MKDITLTAAEATIRATHRRAPPSFPAVVSGGDLLLAAGESDIRFSPATVTIQAEAGTERIPSFESVAYSGGKLFVAGFKHPVVVDLGGLELNDNVNILMDHKPSQRVGHPTKINITATSLEATGLISAINEHSREVINSAKNGFGWHFSIGARIVAAYNLPEGRSRVVNGQTISGPAIIATKSKLNEISFVGVGGDEGNRVQIAAANRGADMNFSEWLKKNGFVEAELSGDQLSTLQAAYAAEQNGDGNEGDNGTRTARASELRRVAAIEELSAGGHAELCATAIEEGWDIPRTEIAVLRAERDNSDGTGTGNGHGGRGPAIHRAGPRQPTDATTLEAAFAAKGMDEKSLTAIYGERIAESASRFGRKSMLDLFATSLHMSGQPVPDDKTDLIQASLSHRAVTVAVSNSLNKVVEMAFMVAPASWRSFADKRSVNNFHPGHALRPTMIGNMQKVTSGGEIRHGQFEEKDVSYQIDTFGHLLTLSRTDLINDDAGLFEQAAPLMGRSAMRAVNTLAITTLEANAGSHFHANNSNLLTGAGSALQASSLETAIQSLRTMTDSDGAYLDLVPAVLLVPPSLQHTARSLVESSELSPDTSTDSLPTGNTFQNVAAVVVEPRISVDTNWYLTTGPSDLPFVVAFLGGRETPTTRFYGYDAQPDKLVITWQVVHDFGAALGDSRCAIMSDGA